MRWQPAGPAACLSRAPRPVPAAAAPPLAAPAARLGPDGRAAFNLPRC